MNHKIKFLELVLSDLVSERDTLEMDLNEVLNSSRKKTQTKKDEFKNVLGSIVETNNKIKTLTEYLSTPDLQYNEAEKGSNNNK
jgi:hypothetical protein